MFEVNLPVTPIESGRPIAVALATIETILKEAAKADLATHKRKADTFALIEDSLATLPLNQRGDILQAVNEIWESGRLLGKAETTKRILGEAGVSETEILNIWDKNWGPAETNS